MSIRLTIIAGPQQGRTITFTEHDTFVLGRAPNLHASFPDDPWFSRAQCLLEINPPLCRLVDLKSRNGTRVNNQCVTVCDLKHGDTIQAGTTVLQVEVREDSRLLLQTLSAPPTAPPPQVSLPSLLGFGVPSPAAEVTSTASPARPASVLCPTANSEALPDIPGYAILKRIGRGGMGEVYQGRRQDDGRVSALKIIRPQVKATAYDVACFLREARILKKLRHSHIVGFLNMNAELDLLYFVMEYVPGPNLGELASGAPGGLLPLGQAARLMCQVLDALAYAHGIGFVHRDIKPSNILVSQQGGQETAKLADFGLAKAYHASPLSGLTLTGTTGGTAPFMPPEQALDFRSAKPAADQFSTAASLYTLLTRRHVYDAPTQLEMMVQALHEDYQIPPLRQHRPDLPAQLEQVLQRSLARHPEARYPDVATFRQELLPFADG